MRWFYIAAVTIRTHPPIPSRAIPLAALLLLSACATLPPGLPEAPADDPGAATLTLPGGRTVPVYPDELEYTGDARLEWPDGRVYEGEWVEGQPHGEGTETRPDGSRYQGDWQAGRRHGQGILDTADGHRYEGDFVAGVREGQGTLASEEGRFQGDWVADLPHGRGIFDGEDGTRYEGEWRHGQRSGYGRYTTPDGSVYEGDWAGDQPHGFGRLENPSGAFYEGEWRQGEQSGYGYSEGPPGLTYEGTWVAGERDGFGVEQRPDGSRYRGEWQAGKRHGQGREERPDGSFHDGTWEFNQPLGPGHRRAPTGIEISGMWNDDTVSTGLLILPTGLEFAGPLFSERNAEASERLVAWLEEAAERGDPFAQMLLGTLYLDFEKPAPDPETARRWLSAAADAGIAEAQYRLALTYEDVNPPRVVELLAEAARQDHAGANETLGEYYYQGQTVPRNLERAATYYEQAVAQGSVSARNNLAWLLATASEPALRNGERAVALIRPIALYTGAWQYLDTLAAAWAAAGDYRQAVDTAEHAIEVADRQDTAGIAGEVALMQERLAGYRNGQPYVESLP